MRGNNYKVTGSKRCIEIMSKFVTFRIIVCKKVGKIKKMRPMWWNMASCALCFFFNYLLLYRVNTTETSCPLKTFMKTKVVHNAQYYHQAKSRLFIRQSTSNKILTAVKN